ncbi:MAG TPA: iron ABC transporter permease [Casimicrobiaceae bacterium]|jgi:iron(III) transport system permease protein|nr:iron ABC transporter permease [Casimicrobiaceae bacterium]
MTAVAADPSPARPGRGWVLACLYPLVAVLVALFVAYPIVELLARAMFADGRLSLGTLLRLLSDRYTLQVVGNTLVLGLTVAIAGTILATLYAYAMTRVEMPWKPVWHFLALLPTISPPILMALSLILLYGRRGLITNELLGMQTTALYGYRGLVAAQILSYFPFAYLLLLNLFRNLDVSLEEAAGTMGANPGKVLTTISLPLLMPGLGSAFVLLFGYSFADLGNPLLLGGDYPVLSSQIYLTIIGMYDIPKGAALAVILLVPAVLLFFVQKRLAERTAYASVGSRGSHHPQVRDRAVTVAALIVCGLVSVLILMQYATVFAGATTKLFGIDNTFTLRHFVAALTTSRAALLDTIGLAVMACVASAVMGVLIAYFVARTPMPGRGALDFMANLPLAIPGTVIGLAFALAFNHRPLLLTGTALIIVVVLSVRSLPYATRSGVASLQQLHRSLDEASTTMGATSGQTLWRVLLPLVRPAVIAGMIFTFTRSVTTLSAVIFVVSPHWSLVTPAILSQMDRGDVGEAAALSVILVVLVLLVIHGAPRLLRRDWRDRS